MRGLVLAAFLCAPVTAAPMLRLSNSALVWSAGNTARQTVCAFNAGDGTLTLSASVATVQFPLPTNLGGATVLVNDVQVPLYYTSFGQIAFQMPYSTVTGTALRASGHAARLCLRPLGTPQLGTRIRCRRLCSKRRRRTERHEAFASMAPLPIDFL
jgi:hypothetical protein